MSHQTLADGFNLLKPSSYCYIPPGLKLKNSTWCSHCF